MKKLPTLISYLSIFLLIVSCRSKTASCDNQSEHQLGSVQISFPSCYKLYRPDTTNENLIWVSTNDTIKFKLQLYRITSIDFDKIYKNNKYFIEQDTIGQSFLLTTAIRKDYHERYPIERKEDFHYTFDNQPFWFKITDLNKTLKIDTSLTKSSVSTFSPPMDLQHEGLLIGTTEDNFKIFRPQPNDVKEMIKSLKEAKITLHNNK